MSSALSRTNTGNNQDKRQEVLTPGWILDVTREAFGGEIVLDPCAPTLSSRRFALINYTEADNGRDLQWFDRTFINPPYGDLKEWLATALFWTSDLVVPNRGPMRMVQLIPVRTRRPWWWHGLQGWEVVFLASLAFEGEKHHFPGDLCLASHGCIIPNLGAKETHRIKIAA